MRSCKNKNIACKRREKKPDKRREKKPEINAETNRQRVAKLQNAEQNAETNRQRVTKLQNAEHKDRDFKYANVKNKFKPQKKRKLLPIKQAPAKTELFTKVVDAKGDVSFVKKIEL